MFDATHFKAPSWRRIVLLCLPMLVAAQSEPELAKFGDVIPVLGKMVRTDQDFVDGFVLDLFSPKNRTAVVTQNTSPLSGSFVSGSTGEGFINLSKYSWVIKFNESATDLIAKVELPYDPVALAKEGVEPANTYVGTLAADKKSWVVSEAQRNVHVTENKTRIIKMTSMDGEYMLLGRKSIDTSNIFVQYGQGVTRTVNVTGGADKIQEAEFVDGLRFSIQSTKPFTLNADIPFGVAAESLPESHKSLMLRSNVVSLPDSFYWKVNSTAPTSAVAVNMTFPVNPALLQQLVGPEAAKHAHLVVAKRAVDAPAATRFQPLKGQHFDKCNRVIHVGGLTAVDGQYVVLVAAKAEGKCGKTKGGEKEEQGRAAACTTQSAAPTTAKDSETVAPVPQVNAATAPGYLGASWLLLLGLFVL
ncbi:hypothetical protein CCM_02514 [Cordyceps militaris CM01]|uniref:Uncharacterized protein n=1 Tax=Cordyceps militaris (strain CM01) TaxID=983644 RepID=G3JA73_CORMM|nr:uncharacterized protein CCM_02514 [Cordyceps militaris CM01]EGX94243.1 hypothetical protein CCM_02514 [Cordyceps militaris CM01]